MLLPFKQPVKFLLDGLQNLWSFIQIPDQNCYIVSVVHCRFESASIHNSIIFKICAQNLKVVLEHTHRSHGNSSIDGAVAGTFVEIAHVLGDVVGDPRISFVATVEAEVFLNIAEGF